MAYRYLVGAQIIAAEDQAPTLRQKLCKIDRPLSLNLSPFGNKTKIMKYCTYFESINTIEVKLLAPLENFKEINYI